MITLEYLKSLREKLEERIFSFEDEETPVLLFLDTLLCGVIESYKANVMKGDSCEIDNDALTKQFVSLLEKMLDDERPIKIKFDFGKDEESRARTAQRLNEVLDKIKKEFPEE